jgi:N-acetylglucosaminyl-diphospho-decaprenol L-rhamnosyltransferase
MRPLFIVIVNYRTGRLAIDCLASLAGASVDLRGGRVIVADNDSGDDSVALIRGAIEQRGWSGWIELLALPRNGGFAYGNNAAIARVREIAPDFGAVLLLNPDTIVQPGAIGHLCDHLDANPGVGIVGALIENEAGHAEVSAHAQPSPLGELDGSARLGLLSGWLSGSTTPWVPRSEPHACDWVSGACMAVRREVFEAIGPMDEGFFLYFEEVDFCLRARRAGWSCWFVPAARVLHFEGASTGIRVARRRRPAYWYASRRRFFVKAYGVAGLVAADVLWALGRLSLVTRRMLRLGGRNGIGDEPARLALDLLAGDARALLSGELRHIARLDRFDRTL